MTFEYLEREENLIGEYIERFCADKTTKQSAPIYDGIVNIKKYLKSKYRICWVLKEPYDEGDGKGGGWSLAHDVLDKDKLYPDVVGNSPTWQPMVYVTYSLLNNFIPYTTTGLDWIRDNPKMAQCLREIALVNVNKMPANSRSNDGEIAKHYKQWKPLLFWQLRQYDPQIIIFGYTFQHFQKDLGIKKKEIHHHGSVNYVLKNNKIYIHAYHPAQTTVTRDVYVQEIIDVVKTNVIHLEHKDFSNMKQEEFKNVSKADILAEKTRLMEKMKYLDIILENMK